MIFLKYFPKQLAFFFICFFSFGEMTAKPNEEDQLPYAHLLPRTETYYPNAPSTETPRITSFFNSLTTTPLIPAVDTEIGKLLNPEEIQKGKCYICVLLEGPPDKYQYPDSLYSGEGFLQALLDSKPLNKADPTSLGVCGARWINAFQKRKSLYYVEETLYLKKSEGIKRLNFNIQELDPMINWGDRVPAHLYRDFLSLKEIQKNGELQKLQWHAILKNFLLIAEKLNLFYPDTERLSIDKIESLGNSILSSTRKYSKTRFLSLFLQSLMKEHALPCAQGKFDKYSFSNLVPLEEAILRGMPVLGILQWGQDWSKFFNFFVKPKGSVEALRAVCIIGVAHNKHGTKFLIQNSSASNFSLNNLETLWVTSHFFNAEASYIVVTPPKTVP